MKSILCINLPVDKITLLKLKYPYYYDLCHFQEEFSEYHRYSLLILPIEEFVLFHKQIIPKPVIVFGPKEYLADAFLQGAEDYLKDSWDCSEMIIRLDKILKLKQISINGYSFQIDLNTFKVNGKTVSLTKRENQIIYLLYRNLNSVVEYETFRKYMKYTTSAYEQSLYVTICLLKKKMRKELPNLFPDKMSIRNISSIGYLLKLSCG